MTGSLNFPSTRDLDRRDRAARLYTEARALPPDARTAFLKEACADDAELGAELLSLLKNAEDAEGFFARLAESVIPQDLPPNATVGRYQILACIGVGGMGAVYRARDTGLDRDVALKFLPAYLSAPLEAEERLMMEARIAAALEHPNVCTVHEIGVMNEGRPFIAMAFYEGETLKERLLRGPLPISDAVDLGMQIARGLGAAHGHGIVHRDVKPGNIMVTPDGTVKLLDFGLAKVADVSLTRPGVTPGTVAYMSPEQARGDPVDPRTDLWSLGVVLYEMITGVHPFRGGNERVVLQAILHERPPPIFKRRPEVPLPLTRIIERLLQKAPAARYGNVAELLADLSRIPLIASEGQGSTAVTIRARRVWQACKQQSLQRMMGLVAGLALLVIAGWALWTPLGGDAREIRRLAVLPLANLTGDPQQDFFVAGLHDALVSELSRISELTVISRQSTLRYQGSDEPVPAIARELGVDALIEGSVFLGSDSVRITVQLIRASPEEHVWAETYRGALQNALALQSEVARAIARAIHTRAKPGVEARLAARPTVSPEAQEAYLKGLYHLERQSLTMELSRVKRLETLDSAIAYLERAVALAPGWATAHAKLAQAYHWVASSSRAEPAARFLRGAQGETGRAGSRVHSDLAAKFYPKSKASALRALELDESEPVAHAALAFVLFNHEWDWVGAEREIQRALALDPNSGQWIYAMYLVAAGRYEEAVAYYKLAEERYPVSLLLKVQLAETYSCAGRHDEAIAELEELQTRLGDAPDWLRATLGEEYLAKSMHTEAITKLEQAVALSDSEPGYVASLADVQARAGRVADARKLLSWLEDRPGSWWAPQLYIALGDTARAVAMVQTAFEESPDDLVFLRCHPLYPALRRHPRIQEIVRRIGFPPDTRQPGIVVR